MPETRCGVSPRETAGGANRKTVEDAYYQTSCGDRLRTDPQSGDEVFPATYREIITSSQMDYMMKWMYAPEVLRREMRTGVAWFIASSDGEPCGYLSVQQEAEELFHLQKIYVLPRFQGLGVGEFLFRHAVEYVRSVHPAPCRMELNVNRSNRAVRFYEKMGMRKLREGDFPIGDGYYMNDYIMGLEIE